MKTKRIESGNYEITVGGHHFTAKTLEYIYDDPDDLGGRKGWRLLIQDEDACSGWEWCNDFATLWECKEAAVLSANDLNE
jgi:hypothetical protein